jgi:Zn finger protein HypA/HybF involved in hydrogenase expression
VNESVRVSASQNEALTRTNLGDMPCDYCGKEFDPISTRWLCPHCHMKANCCDGAPLPE